MNNIFKDILQKFQGSQECEILKLKFFKLHDTQDSESLSFSDILAKKNKDDTIYRMLAEGEKFRFVSLKIQTQDQGD